MLPAKAQWLRVLRPRVARASAKKWGMDPRPHARGFLPERGARGESRRCALENEERELYRVVLRTHQALASEVSFEKKQESWAQIKREERWKPSWKKGLALGLMSLSEEEDVRTFGCFSARCNWVELEFAGNWIVGSSDVILVPYILLCWSRSESR